MISVLDGTILGRELAEIDFSLPSFWRAFFFTFFNPLFWNVAGRLEYNHKIISRLFGGNSRRACYALALCIFSLGLFRDYLYAQALREQRPSQVLLQGWVSTLLGPVLMAWGYIYVISSTLRLGIVGTFLGDYFGILMDNRVTAFPYNVSTHPMYEGATMIFLGYALWNQKLVGILLTAVVATAYTVASHFEGKFTSMVYKKASRKGYKKTN